MNIELLEDGIKIALDEEERNVVRAHFGEIKPYVEMNMRMIIRKVIAVKAIGEERMLEILEERGLLQEGANPTAAEMATLCEEVIGKDSMERMIRQSYPDWQGDR